MVGESYLPAIWIALESMADGSSTPVYFVDVDVVPLSMRALFAPFTWSCEYSAVYSNALSCDGVARSPCLSNVDRSAGCCY